MYDLPVIDMQATARKIDDLRIQKGYSVRDIQDVFDFSSPQAIYNWIRGMSLPSLDSLVVLADLFDVPIDDLIVYHRVKKEE